MARSMVWSKGRVAAVVAAILILTGLFGQKRPEVRAVDERPETSESQEAESASGALVTTTDYGVVEDDVVRVFVSDYDAVSQSPMTDISKGNIRTKYYAYSHGYRLELLHSADTDKISVTISQGGSSEGVDGMRDVFRDVVRAIDPSLTGEQADQFFDSMVAGGQAEGLGLGDGVKVVFSPDTETWPGHIDVMAQ